MQRTVKVKKLSNLIRRRLIAMGGSHQVSHYQILLFIKNREITYQRDIDKEFSLQRPTTTELLKLMGNSGFVVKKRTKNDLRLKEIIITKKGKELVKNIEKPLKATELKFVKNISIEDLKVFDRVIDTMIDNGEQNWYK